MRQALSLLTMVLLVKVTGAVVLGYRYYAPPDFTSDFLHGRQAYFWGGYHWAFYAHILSGPVVLMLGMVLMIDAFRLRFSKSHRILGRVQVALVLLVLAPSGLWMAYYAAAGPIAAVGFALLAIGTALCAVRGSLAAARRRLAVHRRWMCRLFLLLSSTVVLRLLGGLGTVLEIDAEWFDPLAAWASWIVPLAVFEVINAAPRRFPARRRTSSPNSIGSLNVASHARVH